MKKASILILLILICCLGYGQTYPLQQNVGNTPTTKVKTNALEGKIIITAFTDTSAANSEGYLKNYDGAVIKTTTPINALWYRVLDSAKWVQILPTGGGTGGIRAWLDGGNYNVLADGQGNAVFGTLGKNGIKFTTQAIPRFILDSAGILSETGSTIGIGYDPSNGNRLTQYSGGGSGNYLDSFWRVSGIDSNYYRINGVTYAVKDSTGGGVSGWSLTGNAGTTPGTNFIGTTDNNDLVFKRNGIESGRIGNLNTSFTNDMLINGLTVGRGESNNISSTVLGSYAGKFSTGVNNTYIGRLAGYSLFSDYNTSIGYNAGLGTTDSNGGNTGANRNTAIGAGSGSGGGGGGYITTRDNTAIGYNSSGRINYGYANVSVGANSMYQNISGSKNVAIGDSTLMSATAAQNILALGSCAGYNVPPGINNNKLFVNTLRRASYVEDTTMSLLYGVFASTTANQSLSLNAGRVYLPYLTAGVGTKAVRWDATRGLVLADTTVSGGGMVYPSAGIALSTGSAWGTSITDNSTNWNTAYTDRLKWDGGATGLVAATGRTSLGGTTVGQNLFTLANPSAITFPRINADNTVDALSASSFRTAIGAGVGTVTSVTGTTNRITSTGGATPVIDISANYDATVKGWISDSATANEVTFRNPNLGDTLLTNPATNTLLVKSLIAGTNITFAKTDTTITINASGGGSSTTTTDNRFDITSNVLTAKKTPLSLTDGATITWNAATGYNARVTLAGNRTLAITNPQAGDYYTLTVIQDGTGFRTLTLPNGGLASLNAKAGDSTTLTAYYRNTGWEWRSGAEVCSWLMQRATYTLTSSTASQKIFNVTTNGAIYVEANTTYKFTCYLDLSSMSATSGNAKFNLLGAGTATISSVRFTVNGMDSNTPTTAGTTSGCRSTATITTGNMVTAQTGTAMYADVIGEFTTGTGGTIIPSVALTTAAAAVVGIGTTFSVVKKSDNTATSNGNVQ